MRASTLVFGLTSGLVLLVVGFLLLGRPAPAGGAYDVSGLPALNAVLNGTSAVLSVSVTGVVIYWRLYHLSPAR